MTIVYVGGARGVGKTTLLDKIEASGALDGSSYQIVHSSRVLASERPPGIPNVRWGELSEEQRDAVRSYTADYIASLSAKLVIVDAHYVEMLGASAKVIVPEQLKARIDSYVVLEAAPDVVLSRRVNDASRNRGTDVGLIRREIDAERETARDLAQKSAKPFHIVRTDAPDGGEAEMLALLKPKIAVKAKN